MFENPRRGRQARNFTTNAPKILDLKSSSEQIFSRKLPLGAPDVNRYQRKLDFFKQRSHKELYYDAVLKPSFLYGSSVWSSTSKTNLDSILRLQKRPARVILNVPFNSRSVDMFDTLNWIPF